MDNEPTTKPSQRERVEAELKDWGLDLRKFIDRAREAAAPGGRLDQIKKAGTESAKEMEKGFEAAWSELRKAFDEASRKFRT
jgi:hypothetical protein